MHLYRSTKDWKVRLCKRLGVFADISRSSYGTDLDFSNIVLRTYLFTSSICLHSVLAKVISSGLQSRGGGGVLGSGFAGYLPLASQNPHPIIVYSVANYRPHLSHLWANATVISTTEFNASRLLNIKTTAGTIFQPCRNLPIFKSLLTRIFLSQKSRKFATPF